MNCILTERVTLRGKEVLVCDLRPSANVRVEVECRHGRRMVRWDRRNQWCHKCRAEAGHYNTSTKGRQITWGDKISSAKKGRAFTDAHRAALSRAHIGKKLSGAHIAAQNANRPRGFTHPNWKNLSAAHRKIRHNISNLIKARLGRRGGRKDSPIAAALPYSIHELKVHLESRFEPGMSWDNYGKTGWHIDHIVPDSWFSYGSMDDEQFLISWSLNNLQPKWSSDNIRKGNRFVG